MSSAKSNWSENGVAITATENNSRSQKLTGPDTISRRKYDIFPTSIVLMNIIVNFEI